MNGLFFGLAFVAVVIAVSRLLPADERRLALQAILLATAAAIYVGSSLGPLPGSAGLQTAGFLLFAGIALFGWNNASLLALGWLGHAVWDLLHLTGVIVAGTPDWYQIACLVADPLLAGYLLYALKRGQMKQTRFR